MKRIGAKRNSGHNPNRPAGAFQEPMCHPVHFGPLVGALARLDLLGSAVILLFGTASRSLRIAVFTGVLLRVFSPIFHDID